MDDSYQDVSKLDPKARVSNALTVLQPGEQVFCTIKRHPMGIFGVYAVCGFITILAVVLSFALLPSAFSNGNTSQTFIASTLISMAVAALCVAFALVETTVYWSNTWTLTSDSLTQIERASLFSRHSSQLSLESLEDVTAEQDGMLPKLFNYGLLRVETAGERSKFTFLFCPNPNYYAARILAAREAFEQHTHQEEKISEQTAAKPQPAPPVEPPLTVAPPRPTMPPESADALPARQPEPPVPSETEIASYNIPDGKPD